ncbi:hypothetical protein DYB32_004482 [Aphanomyces invadans]|uniref:PIH1D1/2/3 CS-like domain-containing protein n=1 Tax=Aphanomyces invadans TaxID=157072 RepID=A0A3R6Z4T3_9STRA|nr:hypothetical protein DYB32_004482 [Aphanomyces invadans]
MVGYNTGFGNFIESNRFDLLWSWLPDLMAIADSNIPTVFTCANDYAVTSAIKECVVGDADDNQGSHDIATPEYTIVSNAAKTDMRITISTPSMETSQNMQLDVSGRALRFVVPGMYFLELDLPWDVASSGDAMQAVYVKKTRTLCIELHSTQYFV